MKRASAVAAKVARLAGIALLILAGYLACRDAAIRLTAKNSPRTALSFLPAPGEVLMRTNRKKALSGSASVPTGEGMARAPLSHIPFLMAADRARAEGDYPRYAAMLDMAIRREPAREGARSRMLELYRLRGRWFETIHEMGILWREQPELHGILADELLLISSDLRARALLLRMLAEQGRWRESFVAAVKQRRPDHPLLYELSNFPPRPSSSTSLWPSLDDYLIWVARLPEPDLPKVRAIFDGSFEGASHHSPFSWAFTDNANASARERSGALDLFARGPAPRTLAVQTIVLPPARYELVINYRLARNAPGNLFWELGCPGGAMIARLALKPDRGLLRSSRIFEIPRGCDVQRLQLSGVATRPGKPLEARIESVDIVRAL